jgi:UDP-glucose 4-epimerase
MVTGGTGFIGSYVVQRLTEAGHRVTILARDVTKVRGFLNRRDIDFVAGDLRDRDAIDRALENKDACVHIALGWGDTALDMAEADFLPSVYMFESAASRGVRHIVYTSSIAAFGDAEPQEEQGAVRPVNYYGATKAATEAFLLALGRVRGVRVNVIRPGFTFGGPVVEGASIYTDRKLPDMVAQALRGEIIELIRHDGTQFIAAEDLAALYQAVLESGTDRRLFTAVGTEFITWEEAARTAVAQCGSASAVVTRDEGRPAIPELLDTSPMRHEFGLSFLARRKLEHHIGYLIAREKENMAAARLHGA